ncbi:MAG: sulfatase-like hydrolase/transferase [Chitinophagaceae bacterium]|nr:sulfatase-like hydrolase/transferase [Chitinophagaceae bacterium]
MTPRFNQLLNEGIYFDNLYASGDRTNKGVPAVLSGYPAMPNTTIIHNPAKSAKLNTLTQELAAKGYTTSFIYGGEPEFANIKSYLVHAGFNTILGRNDFSEKDMNSKWGAHDGVVMERVMKELEQQTSPFFTTWLTLSSHEPF